MMENIFIDLIRINAYAKYPMPYFMPNTAHLAIKPSALNVSNAVAWCIYQNLDIL